MFNFQTILESMKRHWLWIIIVAALCLGAGVASSYVKNGQISTAPTYTAQSAVYAINYGYGEDTHQGTDYNYSQSDQLMTNDIRRIVQSDEIAGKLRSEYGSDIVLSTPWWYDSKSNSAISTRYVFIMVTAKDPNLAVEVAQKAAEMTVSVAPDFVPVSQISVAEDASLTSASDVSKAAEWGTGKLESVSDAQGTPTGTSTTLSVKNIVVFLIVGLALSILGFAAYDILTRRVRSAADVERLLDIPVLAEVSQKEGVTAATSAVTVLSTRNNISDLVVVGASKSDNPRKIADALGKAGSVSIAACASLAEDAEAALSLLAGQALLIVLVEGASSGKQIQNMMKQLKMAGTPVLGCVFVSRK